MKNVILITILIITTALSTIAQEKKQILTLERAIEIAIESNPELKVSNADVDLMKARVLGSKSNYYPQVESRFIFPFIGTESGVFLDQQIWDFGRTSNLVKASKANLKSSKYLEESTQDIITQNVTVAYYSVLADQHIANALIKSVEENEKRLIQIESFLRLGRSSQVDLNKSKVNLGNARLNLIKAQNALEISKSELYNSMGVSGGFDFELVDMLEYKEINLDLETLTDKALESSPELKSLIAKDEALTADLIASKREFFPTIFGRVAYRLRGEGATQPSFIAGIGIKIPIFEGLSRFAEVKESNARLRRSRAEIESMIQQISSEIKELFLNLKYAEESIDVSETSISSSEENLLFAQERFRLGRGSALDMAEAETLNAMTTANFYQAIYSYKIAASQIERAIGEKLQ